MKGGEVQVQRKMSSRASQSANYLIVIKCAINTHMHHYQTNCYQMACFLFHCKIRLGTYLSNMIRGQMNSDQYRKKGCSIQGATNCGASSDPDFIQKYFL